MVDIYTDAGISARKPASKRPELQRLLTDVQAGKGDLVVFTKLDRWFRNIAEYYKVQEVLERCHVDWKTIQEDYDTSTASGRLKINIMLSVAQDEADRTSERIKAVFEVKRQKLEPLTGDRPTGYAIEGKRLVKCPETEAAVDGFFRTFLATGSVIRSMDEAERHGLRISYHLAHKMLGSPAYYGRYFGVDGMTPPYITKEEFDRIQSMRRRVVRKSPVDRVYLFSGLISCGECGTRMGGRVSTRSDYRSYNCTAHYMKVSKCGNRVNLGERKIERFLLDTIRDEMEAWRSASMELADAEMRRDYPGEIAALRSKMRKVNDLYINELITMEECKASNESYAQKIRELEEAASKRRYPDFSNADRLLADGWETLYNGMSQEKKQEFWRILIREIRIYPDRHIEYDLNV